MRAEKHKYPLKWYKQEPFRDIKNMAKMGKLAVKK